MKKAKFFFFTDLVDGTNTLTDQIIQDSFCTLESNGGVDSFLVSSVHKSSIVDPKAYAITNGVVAVHEHPNGGHVSLVLKPDIQPESVSSHLPPIKYYIYRGVKKDSLIIGDNISPTGNQIDLIDYIWSKSTGSNEVSADSIRTFVDPNLGSDTLISRSFIKPAGEAPYFKISGGDSIGIFDNSGFSLEIIFDDYDYDPPLKILETTNSIKHSIEVITLVAFDDYNKMLDRDKREKVLHYLDPSAFYGSFCFGEVGYKVGMNFDKWKKKEDIYENIVSKFANKNTLYIDVRNEHGHSFNYYEFVNGGNAKQNAYYSKYLDNSPIKLLYEDSSSNDILLPYSNYYDGGWPLQKFELPSNLAEYSDEKNIYKLNLPKIRNFSTQKFKFEDQMIYLANGFLNPRNKFKGKEPNDGERFVNLEFSPNDTDYFGPFEIPVPNISLTSTTEHIPMAWYTKVLYIRQGQKKLQDLASHGSSFPPPNYFADYLFFPSKLKLPIPKTEPNQIIYKAFSSSTYVDLKREGDETEEFVGNLGLAIDEKYTTVFIVPEHSSIKSRKGLAQNLSVSEDIVESTSDSFLYYLDKRFKVPFEEGKLIFKSPDSVQLFYQFYKKGIKLGQNPDRSLFAFIFENSNWNNILTFIDDKVNNNEIDNEFDIAFVINNRKEGNDDSKSKTPYNSFNLFLKGFKVNSGEVIPVELDLGIKFFTNKLISSEQTNLIFLDSGINESLVPTAMKKLTCPEFLLKESDSARPDNIVYDENSLKTLTNEQIFNTIDSWAETVYKEDLIDFIKYVYDTVIEEYVDGSVTKYRISSGDRHNLFLIYHFVLSKYIKVENSPNEVSVFLSEKDRDVSEGNVKQIYTALNPNPYDNPDVISLKTYDNVYFPNFSTGSIELNFKDNRLFPREPIESEGFLLEASFSFSLWKVGYTMHLAHSVLKKLASDGSDSITVLDQLRSIYPFFNNLLIGLENNKILPLDRLQNISGNADEDLIKHFSMIFDDTKMYSKILDDFKDNLKKYIEKSKDLNTFPTITDVRVKREATIAFFDIKENYLNIFISCVYNQLGGIGKNNQFFNFTSGNSLNSTSHILPNKRGAFLMTLYLSSNTSSSTEPLRELDEKEITIPLDRSNKTDDVYVIHLGQYGIDQTTFVKHTFIGYYETGSNILKQSKYRFGDFIYRLDKGYDKGFENLPDNEEVGYGIFNGLEKIASFNPELGDIYILKKSIDRVKIKFSSGIELMFNTVSVSEIPAPFVFTYAKSLPDFFNDDVFQIQPTQMSDIWNFSDNKDTENIDKLISILLNNQPQIEVEMTGGFIGKPIVPFGYETNSNYLEDDVVVFLDNSNLNIFKADSNTSNLPSNGDWTAQTFDSNEVYTKGDLISYDDFIYECIDDFDINNAPFLFDIEEWRGIAGKYKEDVNYSPSSEFFNRVIRKDDNGIPTLYFCISSTSGEFNSKSWLKDQQITNDQRFNFDENDNWTPNELSEEVNPPNQGTLDAIQFARLRYSHAKIIFEPNGTLKISIASYASPLISRLDNVIGNSLADPHTIYGQDNTTNAFVTSTFSGDIPSYNQLLTALRCWGIFEAILDRLQERADSLGTEEGNEMNVLITNILNNTSVSTVVSELTSNNVSSNSINYNDYLQMKQ